MTPFSVLLAVHRCMAWPDLRITCAQSANLTAIGLTGLFPPPNPQIQPLISDQSSRSAF